MSRAQQLLKKINEIKRELFNINKQKFDMEMRVNQLNEELWRVEGALEEEEDVNER